MEFKMLEEIAKKNEPSPRYIQSFEQACFLSLRCLYNDFRHGNVDKETAKAEKKAIRTLCEQDRKFYNLRLESYKDYQQNIKRAGELRIRIPAPAEKRNLALECIGAMAGDTSFARLAGLPPV